MFELPPPGCFQNRGTPTWMVKIMENPIKMGWFGGKTHYFRKHPPSCSCRMAKCSSTGWWLNHVEPTHLKNISQNGNPSPNRDENKKYLKPPPSQLFPSYLPTFPRFHTTPLARAWRIFVDIRSTSKCCYQPLNGLGMESISLPDDT